MTFDPWWPDEMTEPADLELDDAPAIPLMRRRLLDRAALAGLPEPAPLIDKTLDLRTVTLLAGYWGSAKTFLGLDWAACVATGRPWQGRSVPTPGRVVYLAAEGAYGLHTRLSAWESAWRRTIEPAAFLTLPLPVNLGSAPDVRELASVLRSADARLLVVDTVARCAVGLDENSARDMGIVVDNLYRLRDATDGGTVLAVHHTGKDRQTVRGSSALEAGVDCVYVMSNDEGRLTLERTKRKDGPTPDVHPLTLSGSDKFGAPILSARGVDMTGSEEHLLSVMLSAFSEVGASKAELRNTAAMPNASFARALNSLVKAGQLVNEGTAARPFYRVAISHD